MSILRQSAGSQTTSSMGFTSEAMTTSLASLSSMSWVTCLRPNLSTGPGAGEVASWPAAFARASAARRSALAALVSGWYLVRRRMSSTAWFLSMVLANWAMAGGTFRRVMMTLRWRCRRMYFGHFTKRERSRPFGCGVAGKKGYRVRTTPAAVMGGRGFASPRRQRPQRPPARSPQHAPSRLALLFRFARNARQQRASLHPQAATPSPAM
mmetsp:Transcript_38716/g.121358  ORF Transcript_38716/g.121358 Transcript_38716/m.121358 type:complete len:210 (+) Transcript_38716:387-1016(+)